MEYLDYVINKEGSNKFIIYLDMKGGIPEKCSRYIIVDYLTLIDVYNNCVSQRQKDGVSKALINAIMNGKEMKYTSVLRKRATDKIIDSLIERGYEICKPL